MGVQRKRRRSVEQCRVVEDSVFFPERGLFFIGVHSSDPMANRKLLASRGSSGNFLRRRNCL